MIKNKNRYLSMLISLIQVFAAMFAISWYERNYGEASSLEWIVIFLATYLLVEVIWRLIKVIFKIRI